MKSSLFDPIGEIVFFESVNFPRVGECLDQILKSHSVELLEWSLISPGRSFVILKIQDKSGLQVEKEIAGALEGDLTHIFVTDDLEKGVWDALFGLSKNELLEDLVLMESGNVTTLISVANLLFKNCGVKPIEIRSSRSLGEKAVFYGSANREKREDVLKEVSKNTDIVATVLSSPHDEIKKVFRLGPV